MMKKIMLLVLMIGMISGVEAENTPQVWVQSTEITGFQSAVTALTAQTKLPILFPLMFPAPESNIDYYANFDTTPKGYDLYIDATPDCQGAKYCNIATLNAEGDAGPLPIYKNMQKKVMTSTVKLSNGQLANYTPGFAMADYWNPQIAWIQDKVSYTLSWQGLKSAKATEAALKWMLTHLVNN